MKKKSDHMPKSSKPKMSNGKGGEKVMAAKAHNMGGGKAGTFPNVGSSKQRMATNIKFNRKG